MRAHTATDKLHEALELLNEAAHEKQEEVYEIFGSKYEHLKEMLENAAHNGQEIMGQTRKKIAKGLHQEEKILKETAAEWDRRVHKDPWVYLGGVALGSLVLGLILGRRQ